MEIAKYSSNRDLEILLQLLESQSGHRERSDPGQKNFPVPVDHQFAVQFDLAPDPYQDFITRAEQVVVGHRNSVERSEGCGNPSNKLYP